MGLNKRLKLPESEGMDAKKILKEFNVNRINVTFRLNEKLVKAFKKAIGTAEQSRIIERLMGEFLDGLGVPWNEEKEKK